MLPGWESQLSKSVQTKEKYICTGGSKLSDFEIMIHDYINKYFFFWLTKRMNKKCRLFTFGTSTVFPSMIWIGCITPRTFDTIWVTTVIVITNTFFGKSVCCYIMPKMTRFYCIYIRYVTYLWGVWLVHIWQVRPYLVVLIVPRYDDGMWP